MYLKDASHRDLSDATLRFGPTPRCSPSARAEKLLKIDPHSGQAVQRHHGAHPGRETKRRPRCTVRYALTSMHRALYACLDARCAMHSRRCTRASIHTRRCTLLCCTRRHTACRAQTSMARCAMRHARHLGATGALAPRRGTSVGSCVV